MKTLHIIAFILLVIGGINWLFFAFSMNLVAWALGTGTIAMVVYVLVGLSAIFEAVTHGKNCGTCSSKTAMPAMK
ncbi:MAG TPA: DUF378 domain-containing protein [Candidatus Paceibacterota bacterium]|nr:DUF378 domain-containing protein [Candidatus Paceibacterota bacterium]